MGLKRAVAEGEVDADAADEAVAQYLWENSTWRALEIAPRIGYLFGAIKIHDEKRFAAQQKPEEERTSVERRMKPIVAERRTRADGSSYFVPQTRNNNRKAHTEVLNAVTQIEEGIPTLIPPPGRPSGTGIKAEVVAMVDNRPKGQSKESAFRAVAEHVCWTVESVRRAYYLQRSKNRDGHA